ncbi:hypothetical protein ASD58_19795 [Duganella sp. Root1480D1]|nr:hypothetical protein ASD58_19795 [Duganella sp. Root1480D1]
MAFPRSGPNIRLFLFTKIGNAHVIGDVIRLRSIVRQVDENIERTIENHRKMDARVFQNFFQMLDNAHCRLAIAQISIEAELERLMRAGNMSE